jgi:endonuclease/exonuclease/phosphatase (EEP) superfamily protein YafD
MAWAVVGPLLLLVLLRLVAHDATMELIVLNAMTSWVYLPAWLVLIGAMSAREWRLVAAAGVIVAAQLIWLDPRTVMATDATDLGPDPPRLRVMSANLLMVNRDAEGIAGEIVRARPDLLLVQELTAAWEARFEASDIRALLPYRQTVAREDSFGLGIYARAPIDVEELSLQELPAFRATLALGKQKLHVINVHTLPPRTHEYARDWNKMMGQVAELVRLQSGPILLAGDLNATTQNAWYRRLLALGLRGAHEDRGRGLAVTWPNGLMPFPPIRLDHLLVSRELEVLSVAEGEGRGSDHRPIVAELALRPGSAQAR